MNLSCKRRITQRIIKLWYTPRPALPMWTWLLWPFACAYQRVVQWRRQLALRRSAPTLLAPVVVVGNLTVGGTGKTPLIIALAQYLQRQGWRPGILLRGYAASNAAQRTPLRVTKHSDVAVVGDEALLLSQRLDCPVVVCRHRYAAAQYLIHEAACNVILSDDGLQHYALPRTVEIAVIDGSRIFGNQFCLPLGPLREPVSRLDSVDFRVCHGGSYPGAIPMRLVPWQCRRVRDDAPVAWEALHHTTLHAVAGIGNPQRFFDTLTALGVTPIPHPFTDHHPFSAADFAFLAEGGCVVMTAKDAVKCRSFADDRYLYLEVTAELPSEFFAAVAARLMSWPPSSTIQSITKDLDRCSA